MGRSPWTLEEENILRNEYPTCESVKLFAERMDRTYDSVKRKAQDMGLRWTGPTRHHKFPTANRPIGELLSDLAIDYERKRAHHESKRDGIDIPIDSDKPIGVLFYGDPHLGDPGCDIEYLAHCLELTKKTEGLYAVNMGDLTNNWVGNLGRLYAHQHTTDDEEIALADWLLSEIPWLAVILGNHDKWGPVAQLLCQKHDILYASHGAKFILKFPSAAVKIDARHTHRGQSQYNPAHGQIKQSYRGSDCDIIIGAHIHTSADSRLRNGVTQQLNNCVRVGAFKRYDDFADSKSFESDTIGPAWLAVIDPLGTKEGKVTGFWDIDLGARMLAWMRGNAP